MNIVFKDILADYFVEWGIITIDQKNDALEDQKSAAKPLCQILVDKEYLTWSDVLGTYARVNNICPIQLASLVIETNVIELIPEKVAKYYNALPIARAGNYLTVALSDTLNVFALDDLALLTKLEIIPVIALESELHSALEKHYHKGGNYDDILANLEGDDNTETVEQKDDEDIDKQHEDDSGPPVIKLVNMILTQAIEERASDIHIEPFEKNLSLRYRIDGVLYERPAPPNTLARAIASRLKVMAKLDISEHRLPQDGRFRIRTRGKEVDFRMSTLPTIHGEKTVLRILDKTSQSMDIYKLGLVEGNLKTLEDALNAPHGMIFVTGPTGSGKTTTLYSALYQLNKPEVNIITVEDPVEYQFHGINQVQVNADIDLTFAAGLRSILRQDPDVVMVGEVRDLETADISVKAALTGHLVLTTLHTNDASGSFARIMDMGLEPFLVASAIRLVIAQRLARKLCNRCKKAVEYPASVLEEAQYHGDSKAKFYQPVGCSYCRQTGYSGRLALFEMLNVDDDIRQMIMNRTDANDIKKNAINNGMITLRQCGLLSVESGITSLEEVLRVTSYD